MLPLETAFDVRKAIPANQIIDINKDMDKNIQVGFILCWFINMSMYDTTCVLKMNWQICIYASAVESISLSM